MEKHVARSVHAEYICKEEFGNASCMHAMEIIRFCASAQCGANEQAINVKNEREKKTAAGYCYMARYHFKN